MGDPAKVWTGPGLLFAAPIGTVEPIDGTAVLGAAWRAIGFTADGTTFTPEQTWNAIYVEENTNPIRWEQSVDNPLVAFSMAEAAAANLELALNLGAAGTNDATAIEPATPGAQLRVMLILNAVSGARWVFRRCIQVGAIAMPHKKSPDKMVLPVQFRLEDVSPLKPWKVWPTATGDIG